MDSLLTVVKFMRATLEAAAPEAAAAPVAAAIGGPRDASSLAALARDEGLCYFALKRYPEAVEALREYLAVRGEPGGGGGRGGGGEGGGSQEARVWPGHEGARGGGPGAYGGSMGGRLGASARVGMCRQVRPWTDASAGPVRSVECCSCIQCRCPRCLLSPPPLKVDPSLVSPEEAQTVAAVLEEARRRMRLNRPDRD